jgi:fluoroacetyl-CoA thioesterase
MYTWVMKSNGSASRGLLATTSAVGNIPRGTAAVPWVFWYSKEFTMPQIGATAQASFLVQHSDTAQALRLGPEDDFPAVLATARMIALMELAAARVLRPHLTPGELSVGVQLDVRHTAATPIGCTARAVATYQGVEGKLHRFNVEAFDDAGVIGSGTHTRAVILTERLLAGAGKRLPG